MKSRSDILNSRKAALLGGAMLVAMLPATGTMAAEAANGWYWNGSFEAGSNIFIQKPGDGWGKNPAADPWWFTPSTTNSNAKMDEYGKVPRNVFLNTFELNAGSKDGRYAVDFYADNVGMDNQRYYLGIYEPGRQYFNMGWDQTPHLLGYGKSIFGGVGTTNLTVDAATRTFLQSQLFQAFGSNAQNQTNRNNIDDFINGRNAFGGAGFAAPMNNIELKTLREKFTIGYRNTMLSNWDFNVDYSHEHRTGTRPLGIGYGFDGDGVALNGNVRPSSGAIEVPQPLNDRTQNFSGTGEYVGTTPWGTKWNTSVKYTGSYFSNENKVLDVQNPFCITCVVANGPAVPAWGPAQPPVGANLLRYGLYADNHVNGVTWNTAVNIPIFKTRYTSNVQYMMFRQNDPFINTATNGLTLAPYPAASLNGEVNAFLSNNVLYSHLTHSLTNTAKVRYYDRKDNTPTLTFTNYAYGDASRATTAPLTRNPHSYTQLSIEDLLKWQANRAWAFGAGYFFERFTFANGEVDATNENGVKGFVNWTPYSWLSARSSLQYSERRYNTWTFTSTNAALNAQRFFFVNNRDRTKSNTVVELQVSRNVTVSPNGGLRWDNYPTGTVVNQALALTNTLGTQYDRAWNIGSDLSIRWTPDLRTTFGYNHEEHYLYMESCCGQGGASFNDTNKWTTKITQKYNTFMAAADWKAIPGKLDIKADYVAAISNEANNTRPCTSGVSGCTGNNSVGVTNPFPDEHNIFQRFSVMAKYYLDPAHVKKMGFGEMALRARYTWEQNKNTNWATDNFSPYSPSPADAGGTDISNGGRSLFLAYANPNYTAQILALSLVGKW